jgi:tetratricopeptide (TPR) repeat protein
MNKKILSQRKKIAIPLGLCLLAKLAVILMSSVIIIGCTRLKTPEIKGVVVDAETGKPITDAKIYAKWERKMRGFGGESSGGIDKELHMKTKDDGTFLIPARTLINFIPSPIGIGGDFHLFVYSIGYKNLIFDFFDKEDFERRYQGFENVVEGKEVIFRMSRIKDPEPFIKNRREVSSNIQKDKEFKLKEDQFLVEKFGKQRWNDRNIQYELAEAYYRLGDYKLALRKLDEILEIEPNSRTKYFDEKYEKYRSELLKTKQ